jgi:glutathione reductase (NADPH)
MAFDFDLFVIGGGSAGVRCGRIAASHGARVGVAEGRFWGGTCVNIGCVPKKILVQASEYGALAEDAAGFGWRGAASGTHDWAALIATKDREITRLNGIYRRLLDAAGASVFEAHARFLDPHRIEVGGRVVSAERIVIATGGRPLRPDIPGAALGIVSDDAFYLDQRPERVVILGSGYIAVEFAGIFRGLGAEVDLVFRQPLPLRGFDQDLRAAMAEALAAQGVRLFPESNIAAVDAMGAGRVAVLQDGRRIAADCVFFASGRGANTEGLGLERAGVATNERGAVIIGEQWRTSAAHIFAIGDVTDRLNLTPVATAEGHALADRLFAGHERRWNFAAVPTAVFSTPPLATIGLSEDEAAARGKTDIYLTRFTPMRHTISGRARKTLIKLVVDHASGRVLGAHMFGEDAPEIMQGIAVALTAGATKAAFDQTIGIHPTAAEEFVTLRAVTRSVGGA